VAASNQQKSDLLQIVLLTFVLCTVFFAGWGVFSRLRGSRSIAQRDREVAAMKSLEKELKDPKSVQAIRDQRARDKSKENSAEIDAAVASVLQNSPMKIQKATPRPKKQQGGSGATRVFEHEYKVTFNPAPIDEVFAFLARLEAEQPHLEFRGLSVMSKKRKEEDPDHWELDITLVTYTTES
jgi:hypothetical protein